RRYTRRALAGLAGEHSQNGTTWSVPANALFPASSVSDWPKLAPSKFHLETATSNVRRTIPASSAFALSESLLVKKRNHAPPELFGRDSQSSRVHRAPNSPQFLWSRRRAQNSFRMPAGKHHIRSIADQQQREGAPADGFFRRNFARRKSRQVLAAEDQDPAAWRKECLAEQRPSLQAGVVIRRFL